MTLFLMQEAMTMPRDIFIETVNADFRKWAREHGAHSGIMAGIPKKTGTAIVPRVSAIKSNLEDFDQKFECACGYDTHIAGQFWDHCHGNCPILNTRYTPLNETPLLERKEHGTDE